MIAPDAKQFDEGVLFGLLFHAVGTAIWDGCPWCGHSAPTMSYGDHWPECALQHAMMGELTAEQFERLKELELQRVAARQGRTEAKRLLTSRGRGRKVRAEGR